MKHYLILLTAAVIGNISLSNAQVFDWKVNDSLVTETTDGFAYMIINMTNTSGDSLLLDWNLLENSFHQDWEVTLCDYNTCYIGIPDSGSMKKLADGENGFLTLTVNAAAAQSKGVMRFYIYDEQNPGVGDTATFILDASVITTGIDENPNFYKLNISPNPASNQVRITGIQNGQATVRILDLNGREILGRSFQLSNGGSINTAELAKGIYIMKAIDNQGEIYYNRLVIN